ncbi:hypothetical protein QOT17_000783 [Balamuthia mandrillaris]
MFLEGCYATTVLNNSFGLCSMLCHYSPHVANPFLHFLDVLLSFPLHPVLHRAWASTTCLFKDVNFDNPCTIDNYWKESPPRKRAEEVDSNVVKWISSSNGLQRMKAMFSHIEASASITRAHDKVTVRVKRRPEVSFIPNSTEDMGGTFMSFRVKLLKKFLLLFQQGGSLIMEHLDKDEREDDPGANKAEDEDVEDHGQCRRLKDDVGPVVKHIIGVLGSEEISESLVIGEKGKVVTIEPAPKLQKSKDNGKELMFCSWIVALGIIEFIISKGNVAMLLVWGLLVENSTNTILGGINSKEA